MADWAAIFRELRKHQVFYYSMDEGWECKCGTYVEIDTNIEDVRARHQTDIIHEMMENAEESFYEEGHRAGWDAGWDEGYNNAVESRDY